MHFIWFHYHTACGRRELQLVPYKLTHILLLLLTSHHSTKLPEANTATHAPPPSQSIQSFPFYTLPGSPISFRSFFMTFSHPRRARPAFHLALNGWLTRTFFGNLSSFIRITNPSHLNLSFIVALENMTGSHLLYSLLFGIQSARYLEHSIGNFSRKHLANIHMLFGKPILQSHIWQIFVRAVFVKWFLNIVENSSHMQINN